MSSADPARAVRVLVAEVADPTGRLSGLLESAGHRVVARAVTPEELAHLVQIAQPEVAVFDAEVSAQTVAAFRASQPDVGVVVVWPEGTTAEVAHEQVPPARIRQDLPGAVRRAAPAAVATSVAPSPAVSGAPTAHDATWLGRGGLELAVAATLTFLLVVAAVTFRVAQGEGVTLAGAVGTSASPPASVSGTNVPVVPPEPPSAATTAPTTGPAAVGVGEPRPSPGAPSGEAPSAPTAPIVGEPGSTQRVPVDPRSTDPAPASPIPGGVAPRRVGNGPTTLSREQACRRATAQLGIVRAGASMRRWLDRCVATDSAGLLLALARLLGRGGTLPGRGPGHPAQHRGGPGGRGASADHRQDGSGRHGPPPGHGPSKGHGSEHRPVKSGSGHGGSAHHGNGSGHGKAGSHGPGHRRPRDR